MADSPMLTIKDRQQLLHDRETLRNTAHGNSNYHMCKI